MVWAAKCIIWASLAIVALGTAHALEPEELNGTAPGWAGAEQIDFSTAYTMFNVKPDAPFSEIKKAHNDLVKRFHPDRAPNSQYLFSIIREAYEVLRDNRADYDRALEELERQQSTASAYEERYRRAAESGEDWVDLSDLYPNAPEEAFAFTQTHQTQPPTFTLHDALFRTRAYRDALVLFMNDHELAPMTPFRSWLATWPALIIGGPWMVGRGGHWIFQGVTGLTVISILNSADQMSPLEGSLVLAAEMFVLWPGLLSAQINSRSNAGHRDWRSWSARRLSGQSPVQSALITYDLFRAMYDPFFTRIHSGSTKHVLHAQLLRLGRKEPRILQGLIFRYLHDLVSPRPLLLSGSPSRGGHFVQPYRPPGPQVNMDTLARGWREAFERDLGRKPRFWRARLKEAIEILEAETDPEVRRWIEPARQLRAELRFQPVAAASFEARRICEWSLVWVKTFGQ